MKLLYRDEQTPDGYEPIFFRRAAGDEAMAFERKPVKVRVGQVKTPYHEMVRVQRGRGWM